MGNRYRCIEIERGVRLSDTRFCPDRGLRIREEVGHDFGLYRQADAFERICCRSVSGGDVFRTAMRKDGELLYGTYFMLPGQAGKECGDSTAAIGSERQ